MKTFTLHNKTKTKLGRQIIGAVRENFFVCGNFVGIYARIVDESVIGSGECNMIGIETTALPYTHTPKDSQ
jgi:hypothetical protein